MSIVEAGIGTKRQIMCIKMHILDVISSVSMSSKCTKIVGGWDFAPDFTRKTYNTLQTP